jgi:hypothetical protein
MADFGLFHKGLAETGRAAAHNVAGASPAFPVTRI